MNNLDLSAARAEMTRRITDAEQRRHARTFRTGRRRHPLSVLVDRLSGQL